MDAMLGMKVGAGSRTKRFAGSEAPSPILQYVTALRESEAAQYRRNL